MVGRQEKKTICATLPFLLCFILYFRAISKNIFPGGGGLRVSGGLWLEGLIHKVAYFRNFTVL